MVMEKIGILGGTFSPPHKGHVYMAECCYHEFGLDRVLIVPLGKPPHKRGVKIIDDAHRLNMLRAAFRDANYVWVSDMEIKRSGFTYTVDTLTDLKHAHPEAELYYIIGEDTLYEIEGWKNFQEVAKLTQFLCVGRPGSANRCATDKIAELLRDYGAVVHKSKCEGPDISSTDIRDAVQSGKDVSRFLPDGVIEYMEKNHVCISI
jgi:nicotinate-nucleotide adenylyltransferase